MGWYLTIGYSGFTLSIFWACSYLLNQPFPNTTQPLHSLISFVQYTLASPMGTAILTTNHFGPPAELPSASHPQTLASQALELKHPLQAPD